MISKKRVTFLRSLKLVSTFILCTLVVYLAVGFAYNNSPLAVEHTAGSKYHKTRLPLQAGIPRKPLRPLDCKLHRLRGKTNITRKRHFISPKCKRVEPSPESCRIAEELFHNLPPGNCEHQTSHKFCSLLSGCIIAREEKVHCKRSFACFIRKSLGFVRLLDL
ncbi:hypothetical protein BaRGS_00018911 [Batillaria attramentaria]|uniref:Secreted protein n=1 Tax=Batillaria attramentaria TaxID=370345 RepID=A0ABD0KRR4_9CAEN